MAARADDTEKHIDFLEQAQFMLVILHTYGDGFELEDLEDIRMFIDYLIDAKTKQTFVESSSDKLHTRRRCEISPELHVRINKLLLAYQSKKAPDIFLSSRKKETRSPPSGYCRIQKEHNRLFRLVPFKAPPPCPPNSS